MDKKLQKEILKLFCEKRGEYTLGEGVIFENIRNIYRNKFIESGLKENNTPYNNEIEKEISFLLDDGSLIKTEYLKHYRLAKWGELQAKGFSLERIWYWLIYRKHNLAVLIAIISLILSVISLFYN